MRIVRPLPVLLLLLGGCLGPPSDTEQIRAIVERHVSALNRDDVAAAYHLTDLDFRTVCRRERYALVVQAARAPMSPARVVGVQVVSVRGARAEAEVSLDTPTGAVRQRLQFVKEGGRWYLSPASEDCGVPSARSRTATRGQGPEVSSTTRDPGRIICPPLASGLSPRGLPPGRAPRRVAAT